MTPKFLLFDCDGVLVQSEALACAASCELVNEILAKHGVQFRFTPETLMHEFVGHTFCHSLTKLAHQHGFELTAKDLEHYAAEEDKLVIARLLHEVEACDGVNAVLSAIQGKYTLAVVSSSSMDRILASLRKVGQDVWITSERVFSASTSLSEPRSKPDPAVYLHAIERLGATKEECVAIEDSESGVRSAVAAGITVIGYVGSYPANDQEKMAMTLKDAGALITISEFGDLLPILSKLNTK